MKKVIHILAAGLKKDEKGDWKTSDTGDNNVGALGGNLRVEAAVYLAQNDPDVFLIVTSGQGTHGKEIKEERPTLSEIMKKELLEKGIGSERIISEDKSDNTWQQLLALKNIIKENNLENVEIVSNEYHLERIRGMISKDLELDSLLNKNVIKLQSAEEILLKHDKEKWQQEIDRFYNSEQMGEIKELEEKGVRELREGKYKLR